MPTPYRATITLALSEAQWDLYPDQSGDKCVHTMVLDLPDGPWVQFTYDSLRTQDGGLHGPTFRDGYWHTDDGRVWTDMTIEIRRSA